MSPETTPHDEWMDAFFASYYSHRPVNATFVGVHDFDHRLPDCSDAGLGDLLATTRRLLEGPDASAEAARGLSAHQVIDRRLARGFLEIQERELAGEHFQRGNPSFYTGEAVFGIIGLFLTESSETEERVRACVSRMEAMPDFLEQARANVNSAPQAWTERAIRECDGALELFNHGIPKLLHLLGTAVTPELFRNVGRAAATAVSAFSVHRSWLQSELMTRVHDRHSVGPEAFDLYLRKGHFIDRSAEEVRRYAEDQMAEAQAYLVEHASDFGAGTPAEALAGLADIYPAADGYEARYQDVWDDVYRVAQEQNLLTWPDFPIRYVPRPEWTRAAAPYLYFLFYRSPAAFARPPVHDYLIAPLPAGDSTPFLRANNDSVIKLNHVIHHGGLGHHVQNWHAFRAESRVGRMAAVDCASRVAMFCGGSMAEGWACYATDLASEAGALTPLEQYAETSGRVRMAARAIVDVRLHHGEMDLDSAAAFYEERAGMSAAAARGEAAKNSMFPATALMYLMGTDAIHDLRAQMQKRDGPRFDLCRFHDDFLSYGSIPVPLIAEDMLKEPVDAE